MPDLLPLGCNQGQCSVGRSQVCRSCNPKAGPWGGECSFKTECGVGGVTKSCAKQFVDMCPLEWGATNYLDMLVCGVREFFDRHNEPFLITLLESGRVRTFNFPTARVKRGLKTTEGTERLFLLVRK